MVMSVNTNISSLNAQKNLATSQSKLSTAIERLSSGMRINSAKDDAAGLAISTRFTTQINGLNTAVANANDGISLAQTTESALNEVTNNMQRIRQLAVQSANATNSDSDRAALDAEVQQRLSEITRISQQTTFNGRHVLDGTFGNAAFQIGANVGETISVDLSQGAGASQIGQIATTSSADASAAFQGPLTLSGTDLTLTVGSGSAVGITGTFTNVSELASAINRVAGTNVATIDANGEMLVTADATNSLTFAGTGAGDIGIVTTTIATSGNATTTKAFDATAGNVEFAAGDLSINGKGVEGKFKSAQALVDKVNSMGIAGVSAYYDADAKSIHLNSQSNMSVETTVSTAAADLFGTGGDFAVADGSFLDKSSIATVSGANDTISRIDSALTTVSSMRSDLGAVQNRFTSTIANLQTISQNLSASRSQILDADFASETANMSSANILQQAGVAVLAQANASTQGVLQLLR